MEKQDKILDTNPNKYIIAGLLVIALFFGGLTVWSVYFPFQGAVIASGKVTVLGERQVVQHLEGGMIENIIAREGSLVTEGDVLIELKSSQISSNVDLLQGRLWAKLAEAARFKAEAVKKPEIDWPDDFKQVHNNREIAEIKSTEADIFRSRLSALQAQVKLYNSQIKQIGNQIDGAAEELSSVEKIILNLKEDLGSKRPLLKDRYMGKSSILELERALFEHKGRSGRLKQNIAGLNQVIQERKLQIVLIWKQYREEAVSNLGDSKELIFEIQKQIKPQLDAQERLVIRAPISGVVINMQIHSETSGVISPGMPLLEIVPSDLEMIVVVQVRPQDIISVRKGQQVRVQLAAFQRKSTPPIFGKVVHVSPDLIMPGAGGGAMPHFEAHVEVDREDLEKKGAFLSPGMPVISYITTDKRTIISYILGPLLRNVDTALRE